MKMLVAEDNKVSRMLLEGILKMQGHDVVAVEDGKAALDAFKKADFDMLFVDWMMPRMDGLKLSKKIRELEDKTSKRSYIIMITAKTERDDMLKALEAGVDDFISKPFKKEILESRINIGAQLYRDLSINAVDILMEEHNTILRMTAVLEGIARLIETGKVPQGILDWCGSMAFMLDSEMHHRKEDAFITLFIEKVILLQGESPKAKLFSRSSLAQIDEEHKELIRLVKNMIEDIHAYSKREVWAGVALKTTLESYTKLLREHMFREDKLLFPLSRKYLDLNDMGKLIGEFRKIEESIGLETLAAGKKQLERAEKVLNIKAK
jgi:CheY-like chemotaxis protein